MEGKFQRRQSSVTEPSDIRSFETVEQLERWLKTNHAAKTQLWIRMYKKGSGIKTINWDDCVRAGLAWGWIDGIRKSLDKVSFVQRMTPRRAKSSWSKKNCEHAERLIADGLMQPSGLAHVEAARADGRWEKAYAGSAEMEIPADFLKALRKNVAAKKVYATLNRRNLYAIYQRLHTAKKVETRQKRIKTIIEQLAQGKSFH